MQMTSKQNEYIRDAHSRWNLKIGAVRSGKTYGDYLHTIPMNLRSVRDEEGLNVILGVSKGTIERNVLQPMRKIYTSEVVGNINSQNIATICGVPVYCLGAEKVSQVSKIQGASIKYCYGDEVAKWNKDVFEMLKSRLDKSYSRFDGACNPESPTHWLKTFIEQKDVDKYIQEYTIFDNPFLPKSFVESLCNEYAGTVYYDRYILGQWALAEGLIYPMYQDAIVEGLPRYENGDFIEPSEYVVSIDYGTMNAFAALLWSKRDGVWYAEREYYYSGRDTGIQKTDQEYAEDLDEWVADVWEYNKAHPSKGILFGTAYKKVLTIIDPSAASFIAVLNKRPWCKVMPADNAVLDGIRETAVALQTGKIKILSSLKNWKGEAGGYVWDETSAEEKPLKVADHLMDSMRYFIKTMRVAEPKRLM